MWVLANIETKWLVQFKFIPMSALKKSRICLFIHLYYEDTWLEIYQAIKQLLKDQVYVILHLPVESPFAEKIEPILKLKFPNVLTVKSTNRGKDIGAKLVMLHVYQSLSLNHDYFLFIHDKKSQQIGPGGNEWRKKLLRITDPKCQNEVFRLFQTEQTGMVGAQEHLISETTHDIQTVFLHQRQFTLDAAKEVGIHYRKEMRFVGGTMFWVRSTLLLNFFKSIDPLFVRSNLENGNVLENDGVSLTHAWERILGWMVCSQGYKIEGI